MSLPYEAAPLGEMFERNTDESFKELPNVFGIADDTLVVSYYSSGPDHDIMLYRKLQISRKEAPKLDKDICCFRCTLVPFLERSFPGKA